MRKHQKQQILEFISTLHEAHEEIKTTLESGELQKSQNMLCDCQECAIELGSIIEAVEGEGAITVSYIEKYCELLYHYHEKLNTNLLEDYANNKKFSKKLFETLNKHIFNIEYSINNDIKEKKEVVFFPYKASMWDSLESVYLAAKEDKNCDTYCVPIPYYDKKPDGSLGAFHYEGGEYPANIEVTNWMEYNLEQRRPDVVYIHNPYDNINLVTCVEPRFFSSNLKRYTECLVYIPYYVTREIEPDDQQSIDKIKHFIFVPGVINADKVILQSEDMAAIFINEHAKAMVGISEERKREILNKKFLGLGSPKFDKVLSSKREDYL